MGIETNRERGAFPVGILLLALGAVALLGQAGLFQALGGLLGALLFGAAGIYLLRYRRRQRREVWALCAGFGLLGLAVAALPGPLAGTAFLGLTGVGFLVAYQEDRKRWWAVIPAGVLLTLAVIAGLDRLAPVLAGGPVFFLGLAATFWYLYRHHREARQWAAYPAIAVVILAILGLSFLGGWLLPIALIAGGFYLVNRRQDGRVDWDEAVANTKSQVEEFAAAAERTVRSVMSRIDESAASGAEGRAEGAAAERQGAGEDGGASGGTEEAGASSDAREEGRPRH
jgi:hypothetical protein